MQATRELDDVRNLLDSDKAKSRKEGLQRLDLLLDSPDFQSYVDKRTSQLTLSQKPQVSTWPGLCLVLVKFAEGEVKSATGGTRKKLPDALLPRTLRKLIQTADNEQRSGRPHAVVKAAERLIAHCTDVAKSEGVLASPFGYEYFKIVTKQLLLVPQYCQASSPEVFQELMDLMMTRLEVLQSSQTQPGAAARNLPTAQECSETLVQLLRNFPGDLDPDFWPDMLRFFTSMAPWMVQRREPYSPPRHICHTGSPSPPWTCPCWPPATSSS